MKRIIPDTNVLLAIVEFKTDIFGELRRICDFPYKVYLLEAVLDELEKIKNTQHGKEQRTAKLVLQILKTKKLPLLQGRGYADTLLQQHSRAGDFVITQDVGLKRELTRPYLTIRQKKTLVLVR